MTAILLVGAVLLLVAFEYVVYPWLCRRDASVGEATTSLPGDDVVPHSTAGYTLATSIAAAPSAVWPWLAQMGQGRGGFYTHEWVESLLRADIHNAARIVPEWQSLNLGDHIRLTPDPYLGRAGQFLEVVQMEPEQTLVLEQRLPNGTKGTWAFVLRRESYRSTRVLFRRRSERLSLFDRLMMPGYCFMDRGMLAGLKLRAEREGRRVDQWVGAGTNARVG